MNFATIGDVLFYFGAVETILFRSGIFYGNPLGQVLFKERYREQATPSPRREEK